MSGVADLRAGITDAIRSTTRRPAQADRQRLIKGSPRSQSGQTVRRTQTVTISMLSPDHEAQPLVRSAGRSGTVHHTVPLDGYCQFLDRRRVAMLVGCSSQDVEHGGGAAVQLVGALFDVSEDVGDPGQLPQVVAAAFHRGDLLCPAVRTTPGSSGRLSGTATSGTASGGRPGGRGARRGPLRGGPRRGTASAGTAVAEGNGSAPIGCEWSKYLVLSQFP